MLCLPLISISSHRITLSVLPALPIPAVEKPLSLASESWQVLTTTSIPTIHCRAGRAAIAKTLNAIPDHESKHRSCGIYQVAGILYLAGFLSLP